MEHDTGDRPDLSVVLPCFNESASIPSILDRFAEAGAGVDFELVLVDNGSTDDSAEVMGRLAPQYPFTRVVAVATNQGYGHGVFTGLQAARAPVLAWSHADLQTDPADVFRGYTLFREVPDTDPVLIKGHREGREFSARVVSWGMQAIATMLFRTILTEINAQPKVFSAALLQHVTQPPADFNFDVYVLVTAKRRGWRIGTFPVEFPPRRHGQSNWSATWRSKISTIMRSLSYMVHLARSPDDA